MKVQEAIREREEERERTRLFCGGICGDGVTHRIKQRSERRRFRYPNVILYQILTCAVLEVKHNENFNRNCLLIHLQSCIYKLNIYRKSQINPF